MLGGAFNRGGNTTGAYNTAIGADALSTNTTKYYSVKLIFKRGLTIAEICGILPMLTYASISLINIWYILIEITGCMKLSYTIC